MLNFGANLYGFFGLDMGMGQAARAAARALIHVDVDVTIHPRNHEAHSNSDTSLRARFGRQASYPINIFYVNAVETHQLSSLFGSRVLEGKYNIGVWNWELEKLPTAWKPALDFLDEIWAPSTFVRDSILSTGTQKPITLMPYPVLIGPSPYLPKVTFALQNDHYHFLFVADLNSYIERKNPAGAILAFQAAFPLHRKDVRLVIKIHGKGSFLEGRRLLLEAADKDRRIILIDANLGRHATESLHAACDAFISLHRSEGFGLNMAESMWLGKPVVATGYSGNVDFMNPSNSLLVDFEMTPILKGQYLLGEGQKWASPNIDQAAGFMQHLADDRQFSQDLGHEASCSVRQTLSLLSIGMRMKERLLEIFRTITG